MGRKKAKRVMRRMNVAEPFTAALPSIANWPVFSVSTAGDFPFLSFRLFFSPPVLSFFTLYEFGKPRAWKGRKIRLEVHLTKRG